MSFKMDYYLILNRHGTMVCKVNESGMENYVNESRVLNLPVNGLIIVPVSEAVYEQIPFESMPSYELDEFLGKKDEYFTE